MIISCSSASVVCWITSASMSMFEATTLTCLSAAPSLRAYHVNVLPSTSSSFTNLMNLNFFARLFWSTDVYWVQIAFTSLSIASFVWLSCASLYALMNSPYSGSFYTFTPFSVSLRISVRSMS